MRPALPPKRQALNRSQVVHNPHREPLSEPCRPRERLYPPALPFRARLRKGPAQARLRPRARRLQGANPEVPVPHPPTAGSSRPRRFCWRGAKASANEPRGSSLRRALQGALFRVVPLEEAAQARRSGGARLACDERIPPCACPTSCSSKRTRVSTVRCRHERRTGAAPSSKDHSGDWQSHRHREFVRELHRAGRPRRAAPRLGGDL